jgi:hypothetical protein
MGALVIYDLIFFLSLRLSNKAEKGQLNFQYPLIPAVLPFLQMPGENVGWASSAHLSCTPLSCRVSICAFSLSNWSQVEASLCIMAGAAMRDPQSLTLHYSNF